MTLPCSFALSDLCDSAAKMDEASLGASGNARKAPFCAVVVPAGLGKHRRMSNVNSEQIHLEIICKNHP
jgi:hypothetical protein